MTNPSNNPEPTRRTRDHQALIALAVLIMAVIAGWTALNVRVSDNESNIKAQGARLDREIVIQNGRFNRMENYLIRIEDKVNQIDRNNAGTNISTASNNNSNQGNQQ